ncbi:hypothetical protein Sfulv_57300 [Streptomyces fulvorobeus]|uniref:Uncharacterized protein n=1 Tax=Streptomyces fulvorobeus TaxID=284028 RepID=A0A7J0CEJ7_9ACTN|nr:hypothetical protein Sfulv_57300 [Streptomyces fulvorobeus]
MWQTWGHPIDCRGRAPNRPVRRAPPVPVNGALAPDAVPVCENVTETPSPGYVTGRRIVSCSR